MGGPGCARWGPQRSTKEAHAPVAFVAVGDWGMPTIARAWSGLFVATQIVQCFALTFGCSVDDRALSEALAGAGTNGGIDADAEVGGAGGRAIQGGSGSGGASAGASATDEAGAAGEAGATMIAAPVICSDAQPTPGCLKSLAVNATFDTDTAHWTADPGNTESWSQQDADQQPASGSLAVLNATVTTDNGSVVAGAGQCVPVVAGSIYDISANVFISSAQGSSGVGGFYASLYPTTDCSGPALSYFGQSTLSDATDVWSSANMVVDTTPQNLSTAQTMSLRLIAQKMFSVAPLTVLFDNVLVQKAASQ